MTSYDPSRAIITAFHTCERERSSGLRLGWLTSLLLATVLLPTSLCASGLGDTARQLAHKIAAAAGPGAFALEVTNRSSLDDKSVREVRSALEAQLHVEGVHTTKAEQAMGTVDVVLSESLREYVWTAEIVIGSDEKQGRPGLVAAIVNWHAVHFRVADRSENNSSVRAGTADARRGPRRNAGRLSPDRAR